MDDPGFSFQTGPGRIVLGAFASADGPGVHVARVDESEEAAGPSVPLWLSSVSDELSRHTLGPAPDAPLPTGIIQPWKDETEIPRIGRYVDPVARFFPDYGDAHLRGRNWRTPDEIEALGYSRGMAERVSVIERRKHPNWPKTDRRYVDPEQVASRTGVWPDEAA